MYLQLRMMKELSTGMHIVENDCFLLGFSTYPLGERVVVKFTAEVAWNGGNTKII